MLLGFDRWLAEMPDALSGASSSGRGYDYWKLPAVSGLVGPGVASRSTQQTCIRSLIRAVERMSQSQAEVDGPWLMANIDWPGLFGSDVCAFYDRELLSRFALRDNREQRWTLLPAERSITRELDIELPSGFAEVGFHVWLYDEDRDPPETECENWMVGPKAAIDVLTSAIPESA